MLAKVCNATGFPLRVRKPQSVALRCSSPNELVPVAYSVNNRLTRGSLAIEHDGIASSSGILGVEVSQWRLGDPFAFRDLVLETAHGVVGQTVDVLLGQEDLGLPHKHFAAARVRVENEVLLYEMDFEPAVLTQLVEVHGVSEIARDAVDILAEQCRHRVMPAKIGQHFLELLADFRAGAL